MRLRISIACLLLAMTVSTGAAQEFLVTTKLYRGTAPVPQAPKTPATAAKAATAQPAEQLIARSWSVFHAGCVYDFVDTIAELTVFEPAQERFRIVNTEGMVATVLTFAEIENEIFSSEARARQLVAQVGGAKQAAIAFQLKPEFATTYDKSRHQLQLKHPKFSYNVQCAEGNDAAVAAYVNYINWTAKLNYVLHTQMLPNPRLALNAALESHKVLPLELRLDSDLASGLHLKAVHQYHWKLDEGARRKLMHWDAKLNDPNLKQLKFKEFHLATKSR